METHHLATALGLWEEELSGDRGPSASSKPQFPTANILAEKFLWNSVEMENTPSLSPALEWPFSQLCSLGNAQHGQQPPITGPSSRHLVKPRAAEPAWLLGSGKGCVWEWRAAWPLGLAWSLWPCWGLVAAPA